MNRPICFLAALILGIGVLPAQVPGNSSLIGKYFFRQLQVNADASSNITTGSSLGGTLTFDGAGKFTYSATQNTASASPASVNGSGTYTVKPNGFVTMTKPQDSAFTLNGRVGASVLVASTTEGQSTEFDMLIAIPAPTTTQTATAVGGTYQAGTLEFPGGNSAQVRSTTFNFLANGAGSLGSPSVMGHANNLGGSATSQTITIATYTIITDGSGTATFPLASGSTAATQLVSGAKTIYVSADGNYLLGGSTSVGGLDMFFAAKALTGGTATNMQLSGLYFTAGLACVTGANQAVASYAGSANSAGNGVILFHHRYHSPASTFDFTGSAPYAINPDGTGTTGLDRLAVGANSAAWLSGCAQGIPRPQRTI